MADHVDRQPAASIPAASTPSVSIPSGSVAVAPQPDDDEAAAIVAAYEVLQPPVVVAPPPEPARSPWRFSARWWARPVAARRDRPWS